MKRCTKPMELFPELMVFFACSSLNSGNLGSISLERPTRNLHNFVWWVDPWFLASVPLHLVRIPAPHAENRLLKMGYGRPHRTFRMVVTFNFHDVFVRSFLHKNSRPHKTQDIPRHPTPSHFTCCIHSTSTLPLESLRWTSQGNHLRTCCFPILGLDSPMKTWKGGAFGCEVI